MKSITVRGASANNLKNVSVSIPLRQLVAVIGKSGSGKSSLVYDVLCRAAQGQPVAAEINGLPKVLAVGQRVKPDAAKSLGETVLASLNDALELAQPDDLLIVDEPCAGMAAADRTAVLGKLRHAVKGGLSVIVVEHSKDIIAAADYVIEFGPGSGADGGEVAFAGSAEKFRRAKTPTSTYVFSDKAAEVGYQRQPNRKALAMSRRAITIRGITRNHLHDFDFTFGLGRLVCVTGRVGSGKTSLLAVAHDALFKGAGAWKRRRDFLGVDGKSNIRRAYLVDQVPLGQSSTSTPATYIGIWEAIRGAFADLPESRRHRFGKSHFSINTKFGATNASRVAKIRYQGHTIDEVASMTVDKAAKLFAGLPLVVRKLGFLQEVGLGYLVLGQRSGTLSGGEAQRVRLAKILSKKLGDRCLYILDTPSRGLHLSDLPPLMTALRKIVDRNNTVLIAENREEIIANCDEVTSLSA